MKAKQKDQIQKMVIADHEKSGKSNSAIDTITNPENDIMKASDVIGLLLEEQD